MKENIWYYFREFGKIRSSMYLNTAHECYRMIGGWHLYASMFLDPGVNCVYFAVWEVIQLTSTYAYPNSGFNKEINKLKEMQVKF